MKGLFVFIVISAFFTVFAGSLFLSAVAAEKADLAVLQDSEALYNAGVKDGDFVVVEYRYENGFAPLRVESKTCFIITLNLFPGENTMMMVLGGHDWRLNNGTIVRVVGRDNPEWSEFADKFIRNNFWNEHPAFRRDVDEGKKSGGENKEKE